ncbi:unnamed protein product, partial [Ectocarpus fasciculatus]
MLAAAAAADAGSFSGGDGNASPRRRRRQAVAYVRGGLCALVAFRQRDQRCDGTAAAAAAAGGKEVATGDDAHARETQGEVGERQLDQGAAPSLDESRFSWPAGDDEETGASGWSQLQLLSVGRAIETSLSEDPDLTVLEDDVGDFYFQLLTAGADAGGNARSGSGSYPRKRHPQQQHQQQQSRRSGPVRAVHHQDSPLPCFSGTGVVHHLPAAWPGGDNGDDPTSVEDDNRLSVSGSSGEGSVTGSLAADGSSGGGGSSSALLLFGGGSEP